MPLVAFLLIAAGILALTGHMIIPVTPWGRGTGGAHER